MNSEPLATITCLPTEEDVLGFRAREESLYIGPAFLRDPKRRTQFYAAFGVLQFLSLLFFLGSFGTIYVRLAFLLVVFPEFLERTVEEISYPFFRKSKWKKIFMETKGKAASQNIFLYREYIEIQSISEQLHYPWALLTDWYADEMGFLLSFGQDNVRFIPSRVLDGEQNAVLRELLKQAG